MNDTVKQHFVPQCILRNFANDKGAICVWDKERHNSFSVNSRDLFEQRNLYESRNTDGSFYHRNEIEKELSTQECHLAQSISRFETISPGSEITVEDYFTLSEYLAVQLLRGPEMMELIQSINTEPALNSSERSAYVEAAKQTIFLPRQAANEYLVENNYPQGQISDDWSITQKISIWLTAEFRGILLKAPAYTSFWIGDIPALRNPLPGIDFLLPLSMHFAFCWIKKMSILDCSLPCLDAEPSCVDQINTATFIAARKRVAFYETETPKIRKKDKE